MSLICISTFWLLSLIDGFEKLEIKISVGNLTNLFFDSAFKGELSSICFRSEYIFNIDGEFFLILKSILKNSFPET